MDHPIDIQFSKDWGGWPTYHLPKNPSMTVFNCYYISDVTLEACIYIH